MLCKRPGRKGITTLVNVGSGEKGYKGGPLTPREGLLQENEHTTLLNYAS